MSKEIMYCCVKTNKLKTYAKVAVAIKHNSRAWVPVNDTGAPNDVIIPYRTPEQAVADIKAYSPRKNAVLAVEYIMIASPQWFEGKTEAEIRAWEMENCRFLEEKHGRNCILGLEYHRGELSIHGHAIVIPKDDKGHLNARYYFGGAKKMRALQDEYAKHMEPFGLHRGEPKITPKAKDEKEFYQVVNKGKRYATCVRPVKPEQLPSPSMADRIDPRAYASRVVNQAIAQMQKREAYLRAGLETVEKSKGQLARIAWKDRQKWQEIKQNPDMIKKLKEALAREMETKVQAQADYKKLVLAVKDFFRHNIKKHDNLRMPEKLGTLLDFPELVRDISFSLTPDTHARQDMERTR